MENLLILLLLGIALLAIGGILWFVLDQRYGNQLTEAKQKLRAQSDEELNARWQKRRQTLDDEAAALAQQAAALEAEALRRQSEAEALAVRQSEIEQAEAALRAREQALSAEQQAALARLSGLSEEAARAQVLGQARRSLDAELSQQLREHEQSLKERQIELAQEILTRAVQRTAVSHAREQMVVAVPLPDASWRGRVIGKEGRTVQALQAATGADFSLDDESASVWISSFDPWRRELARRTLLALLENNRLHPARIEEETHRQQSQLETELPRLGEEAAARAGVLGLHTEILTTLGKLHYRRSFGQDVLGHSVEVALLAAELARQLESDIETARRGALLHDLGKALTSPDSSESHTALGVEMARRCGEAPLVLNAIAAHHGETEPESIAAVLVQIADTLSAARPGARSEQLARHVQRLGDFEKIAQSFEGVTRAWVLRAGREVRVLVDPDLVPEARVRPLAAEIASAIGKELQGHSQVKVSVIREIQATGYAR